MDVGFLEECGWILGMIQIAFDLVLQNFGFIYRRITLHFGMFQNARSYLGHTL